MLFMPWMLSSRDQPDVYGGGLQSGLQAKHSAHYGVDLVLLRTGSLLLAIVAARLGFNRALGPTAKRLAEERGSDAHLRDGRRLLEECWVLLGNTIMLCASTYVMLYRNGGCWYFNASTCLAGWPNHELQPAAQLYYEAELAWYLNMLLKPLLRYGLKDGRDMVIHHLASLALILLSYGAGFTRIGVMVLATFALSNPLLHAAKICNQLNLGPLKVGGFAAFALVFFLSRVLLVPWAILKRTMVDSWHTVPHLPADSPGIFWTANALLALLYLLQLVWMRSIVRVLRRAVTHGAEAASRLSATVDPAKRYAPDSTADAGGTVEGAQAAVPAAGPTQASGIRRAEQAIRGQTAASGVSTSLVDKEAAGHASVKKE